MLYSQASELRLIQRIKTMVAQINAWPGQSKSQVQRHQQGHGGVKAYAKNSKPQIHTSQR